MTSDVRAVPLSAETGADVEFMAAEPDNAYSGDYPLARFLYLSVNYKPGSQLDDLRREFVRFVFSKQGQEVVVKDGYLPVPATVAREELNPSASSPASRSAGPIEREPGTPNERRSFTGQDLEQEASHERPAPGRHCQAADHPQRHRRHRGRVHGGSVPGLGRPAAAAAHQDWRSPGICPWSPRAVRAGGSAGHRAWPRRSTTTAPCPGI